MTFAERTMRLLVIALSLVLIMVWITWAQTVKSTEDLAMEGAQAIWGLNAKIGRYKRATDQGWTYQVGCYFDQRQPFIVAGEGKSWSEALASVDRKRNGQVTTFDGKPAIACIGR